MRYKIRQKIYITRMYLKNNKLEKQMPYCKVVSYNLIRQIDNDRAIKRVIVSSQKKILKDEDGFECS